MRIQGEGLIGFGETPSEKIFWSNSCMEVAEFGEVNRVGWHEKEVGVVETDLEELS